MKLLTLHYRAAFSALLAALSAGAFAQRESAGKIDQLETIYVHGGQPTTLPTVIPTTIEGITGKQIEDSINAFDSEDALKYFPSLLVRKRYIGDYDHAVLATRASGTGNSARSLVYADGILLSNLLGNGASFTPRWGLVTPEEIERVDVLYGPFSAAYSGNSVGAVVDYVTRMPKKFEAYARAQAFTQNYKLYGTDQSFSGHQASVSLGDRQGPWAWWVNVNRLTNDGQPITFATKTVAAAVAPTAAGIPVTGAFLEKDRTNSDWLIVGAGTFTETTQDHAKLKLAYDFSPTMRASYTFGLWRNEAFRDVQSFIRDSAGNPVFSGNIVVDNRQYTLAPTDIAQSRADLEHLTHGLTIKSNTRGTWDWDLAASLYDYRKDIVRSPTVAMPAAGSGGAGRITDQNGTGWNTFAAHGIWRPDGIDGAHLVEFGFQRDAFKLKSEVSNTSDWIDGRAMSRFSAFTGNTALQSVWAQDAWRFAPEWKTTLGGRVEEWHAYNGTVSSPTSTLDFAERDETWFSPKAALAYQYSPDWTIKTSLGRAVRAPTVSELYQGSISANVILNNDPNLKPEKSWTYELSAEGDLASHGLPGMLRATFFHERTTDALYSQANVNVSSTVITVQNVDKIRTSGFELAYQASDVGMRGLDLASSVTYARSKIVANANFPASVGKRQPRVPDWRANLLATYKPDGQWTYTLGMRYSGKQFNTLDNSDPNGYAYTAVSRFFVADVRVRYQFSRTWTGSLGIDNLNNYRYWNFHPYPQRTYTAELAFNY